MLRLIQIFILLLLTPCIFANIVLENDFVRYEFDDTNGGIVSMFDKIGLVEHIHIDDADATIWGLEFANNYALSSKNYTVSDVQNTTDLDGTKRLQMVWNVGVDIVEVKVALANNEGIASFRIFVNNNSDLALINVAFPDINGFLSEGDYDFALPTENIGKLIKNASSSFLITYPCGYGGIMQFAVMVKSNSTNGVYFAAEDKKGGYKDFGGIAGGNFRLKTLVENANIAGSNFNGDFAVRLGVYQGNWIDGCKIYRNFATKAPWTSKGKLSHREDMLQQFKDIGLWMRYGDTPVDTNKTVAENNAKLYEAETFFAGIPLAINWYFWHSNEFDYDLPNYLPAKPGYAEVFADLVSRGWIVEPYINCRVITEDNISEYADLLATDINGGFYKEFYAVDSYVVCPYTLAWQDKIAEICEAVFDIGANSIYLDQLSGRQTPCYNVSHGHPAGGGDSWSAGYSNMLNKIRNDAYKSGRQISISGEFTNEIHIAGQDAFLFWQMSLTGQAIPMFPMVYSGYTLTKGSNAPMSWTDTAWRMYVGRPFLWGLQCGWMVPDDLLQYPTKAQYLRSVGMFRVLARDYLTYGELVDLVNGDDFVPVQWQSEANLPAIQGSIWLSEQGNIAILLTNFDSNTQSINFTIDTTEYFEDKVSRIDVEQITNRGRTLIKTQQNGQCGLSRTIFPGGIEFLEIKPSVLEGDIDGDQKVDLRDMAILSGQVSG